MPLLADVLSWISSDLASLLANNDSHNLDVRVRIFTTRDNETPSKSRSKSDEEEKMSTVSDHVLQSSCVEVHPGRPDIQTEVSRLTEKRDRVQLHGNAEKTFEMLAEDPSSDMRVRPRSVWSYEFWDGCEKSSREGH
jgi:hypothetical protein